MHLFSGVTVCQGIGVTGCELPGTQEACPVDRELLGGISFGHLVAAGTIVLVGLIVAGAVLFTARYLRRRFRERDAASLAARLVEDMDEPVVWIIILFALFQALMALPPLQQAGAEARRAFTVAGVALVVVGSIRMQGHALEWYAASLDQATPQAKILASLVPMGRRIISVSLIALGTLVALDQFGVTIAPLLAGLGIGGLAVALALQGTLTNFFAGLNILTDGMIRVGDYVELSGGQAGYVDQIGWRTTRIRMLANNMVIIPNSRLADSITTNYNYPQDQMSVYMKVGVSYFSDLERVERVTVEVAEGIMSETPGAVEGYRPSVWFEEFGDSNITFWVVLRAHGYMESWVIKHRFVKALFDRYQKEGIEISFPNRNIFLRSGADEVEPAGLGDARAPATGAELQEGQQGSVPRDSDPEGPSESGGASPS